MRQCHVTRRKLPCSLKERQCPLEDDGFLSALAYYLYSPNQALRCLTGKFQRIRLLHDSNSEIEPLDIAMLFPNHVWIGRIDLYFKVGLCYMDKDFCKQLKDARLRWFSRLSPPGYQWKGEKIAK